MRSERLKMFLLLCRFVILTSCFFGLEAAKIKQHKQGNSKLFRSFAGIGDYRNHNRDSGWSPSRRHSQQENLGGLWPTVFNVAAKAVINSNATCGEGGREVFCRFSDSGTRSKCGYCDNFSVDPGKRHPIHHAIDDSGRWWQSPSLFYGAEYEYVTITLDLKQVYQIAYVIIKSANAPRPASWILERSLDGEIFTTWQYFATTDRECRERYGVPAVNGGKGGGGMGRFVTDTEVVCTTMYSRLTPMENGEIHVSLINGRPGANETSPELLEFIKARYVRIRLQGLRGKMEYGTQQQRKRNQGENDSEERTKRLFYAVKDINIGGQCVCNGHAASCRHNVQSGRLECECGHHTCGPHCDRCCPLFNQRQWGAGSARDARLCLPCNCHGHATACHYDEDVDRNGLSLDVQGHFQGGGVCDNCTDFTTGINCASCLPGYYRPYNMRPDDPEPCFPCDCDPVGALGPCTVAEKTLICECRPGYAGHRCDACAEGYRGYPNCEPCPCDDRGVVGEDDCENECLCKANVDGKFCDQCKPGYFGLKKDNPDGCSQCYCSGVTTLCQSALLSPSYIDTLDDWLLTTLALTHRDTPYIDEAHRLLTVGGGQLDMSVSAVGAGGGNGAAYTPDAYYWLAPPAYLGNALRSYGSRLEARVHWSVMRGDTSGRVIRVPDVVLIGGGGERIGWGDDTYEGSNITLTLPLTPTPPFPTSPSWYHIPPTITNLSTPILRPRRTEPTPSPYHGPPVTRATFLSILADLKAILVRAQFHTDQIEGSLEGVRMGVGGWSGGVVGDGVVGVYTEVEECSCPSGYKGLSCERCEYGHVRIATPFAQTVSPSAQPQPQHLCARCDCNGHSATCDPDTGTCTCEHNTIGERCTRCAAGYYGRAVGGRPEDCQRCACPLLNDENNFSPSCQVDDERLGYVCTQCPRGYTGDHCEICDDGFYGQPTVIGGSCQLCTCGGGPCDRVTGQCLGCKGNTEGWRCERCKAGHFGDPNTQNCEACLCDTLGAVTQNCDNVTGQCQCREFFVGRTCSRCQEGYGNVTAQCTLCACDPIGSTSDICDTHSGLCPCQLGVEGFHCDACQHLHFGFSDKGCQSCNCSLKGSLIKTCEPDTGQCRCKPHFTGLKCDSCEAGFYETESDCSACQCDDIGSVSDTCDIDGQCQCHSNIGGHRCNKCKDKYYGFSKKGCKECDKCEKPGHICDQKTGKCVCPPNTKGLKCEECQDLHHWENIHEKTLGCKKCSCDYYGSLSMQCDVATSLCTCHVGYTGALCSECAPGYYRPVGHPLCKRCSCSAPGTDPMLGNCTGNAVWLGGGGEAWCGCDRVTGQCPCKNNVIGKHCNTCKDGTFGLSVDNPEGCTKCFCFGRTSTCSESGLTWGQIRSAPRILNYKPDQNSLLPPISRYKPSEEQLQEIPETSGDITLTDELDAQRALYWRLPVHFNRDLILSYGGYFRFRTDTIVINTTEPGIGTNRIHPTARPTTRHITSPLLILEGNHLRLEYYHSHIHQRSGRLLYEARLDGAHWQMGAGAGNRIGPTLGARDRLMLVLQNVTAVWVRSTDSDVFDQLTLSDVTLDSAIDLGSVPPPPPHAHAVERCDCPPQYNGTSCQNPSKGYYRTRPLETGNAADVTDVTVAVGIAVKCECNDRSEWCDIENGQCENCRNSTSGSHCEICAEGYYGNPMRKNGTCSACKCPEENRNFAVSCSQNPMVCKCKTGYEGPTCEQCSKGYFGKPHLPGSDCKRCDCNLSGSVNPICDEFGQCSCKSGMMGVKCDQCEKSRHIIKNGSCTPCDECVQDLLDKIESLSLGLLDSKNVTVGPPWSKLDQLEDRFDNISRNYDDYLDFHQKADEIFSKDFTDKYFSDLKAMKDLLKEMRQRNTQNIQQTANMNDTTNQLIVKLDRIQEDLVELIDTYKTVPSSHISTQDALKKGEAILKEIQEIYNNLTETTQAKQVLHKCQNLGKVIDKLNKSRKLNPKDLVATLKDFNGRLIDLDETMNGLRNNISRAEKLNRDNSGRLLELNVSIGDINLKHEEYKNDLGKIKKYMKESKELLQKIGLSDEGFSELKALVFKLQAALDKMDDFDELEEKVLNHANGISTKIDEYKSLFDLDSEELLVVEASNRYTKIVNNVEEANKTSLEAERILNDLLYVPSDDDSIYAKSSIALGDSTRLEKRLENIKANINRKITVDMAALYPRLDDMRMRIWAQGVANINDTRRITATRQNQEKVIAQIQEIEKNVTESSKLAHSVYQSARDMITENETNLGKKYGKFMNLTTIEKFNELRDQIRSAAGLLQSDLFNMDQIKKFKTHNSYAKPSINLSEKLARLKFDIASAMKKLSGIKVPISGASCSRTYLIAHQEPSVATTIIVSIDLPSPVSSTFGNTTLFYLSNDDGTRYMQLDLLENRQVEFTVKLEEGAAPQKVGAILGEGFWTIKAQRIYENVTLTTHNGTNEISSKTVQLGNSAIFDVYAENLVVLGGNSAGGTGLPGCLHSVNYNGRDIGLWTFIRSSKCDPCKRTTAIINEKMTFNGNGYSQFIGEIENQLSPYQIVVTFEMQTFDENALLFLMAQNISIIKENNETTLYWAVYLKSGRICVEVNYGTMQEPMILETQNTYNTGRRVDFRVSKVFEAGKENETLILSLENMKKSTSLKKKQILRLKIAKFFFGGLSENFRINYADAIMDNLKISNGLLGALDANIFGYNGIYNKEQFEFTGLEEFSGELKFPNALFDGPGHLTLKTNFTSSLDFVLRTDQTETSIVQIVPGKATIKLEDNVVKLKFIRLIANESNVQSNPYRPKESNYISLRISDNPDRIGNAVDSTESDSSDRVLTLYVNEIEVDSGWLSGDLNGELLFGLERLNGTIRDVRVDGMLVAFDASSVESFKDVQIGRGRRIKRENIGGKRPPLFNPATPPPPPSSSTPNPSTTASPTSTTTSSTMMDEQQQPAVISLANQEDNDNVNLSTTGRRKHNNNNNSNNKCGEEGFGTPRFEQNTAGFGRSGNSFVRHRVREKFWQGEYDVEVEFRTFEKYGMLMMAVGPRNQYQPHYNLLQLRDGRLHYQVTGKRTKTFPIQSPALLSDGRWHTIKLTTKFINGGKKRRLSITLDGKEVKGGKPPVNRLSGMVYIGNYGNMGDIGPKIEPITWQQFRGCIRKFKLNGTALSFENSKVTTLHQIGQCFPHIEYGSYFSGDAFAKYRHKSRISSKFTASLHYRTFTPTPTSDGILLTTTLLPMETVFTVQLLQSNIIMATLGDTNVTFDINSLLSSQQKETYKSNYRVIEGGGAGGGIPQHNSNNLLDLDISVDNTNGGASVDNVDDCRDRLGYIGGGGGGGGGDWHHVIAGFTADVLQLIVDGVRKDWVLSQRQQELLREYAEYDGDEEEGLREDGEVEEGVVYIGGVPNSSPVSILKNRDNFKGCIKVVKVMDKEIDWTEMEELHNVIINSCPKLE